MDAADGATGLEVARAQLPDLIIVDWEMPLIDGCQFVKMIRSPGDFPAPDTPIIMLSAHSDHWRVVESARIGDKRFRSRPYSVAALRDSDAVVITTAHRDFNINEILKHAPLVVDTRNMARGLTGKNLVRL